MLFSASMTVRPQWASLAALGASGHASGRKQSLNRFAGRDYRIGDPTFIKSSQLSLSIPPLNSIGVHKLRNRLAPTDGSKLMARLDPAACTASVPELLNATSSAQGTV